jgi:macrodomain Ter protein organizer (MatP/YcbG family)
MNCIVYIRIYFNRSDKMKVKKNLSLDDSVICKGEEKAKKIGMSFSGYITYLILRDVGEIAVTKDKKRE